MGTATLATENAGSIDISHSALPAGCILQVLQTYKSDTDTISGVATTSSTGKNSFAFIPGQGSDAVFQKGITVTGSNKVLITT